MAFTTIQGSGANDATTFVGTSGVDFINFASAPSNFFLGAQEADDIIQFTAGKTYNLATLRGGDGDDSITVTGTTAGTIFNGVSFNGNAGDDTLDLAASDTHPSIFYGSTVHGGQGEDVISVAALSGTLVNGNKDDDTINVLTVATVESKVASSSIYGGQGDDEINIGVSGTAHIIESTAISGNDGDDTINVAAGTVLTDVTISGNSGDDTITLSAIATSSEGVTLSGGAGNDTINASAVVDVDLFITSAAGNNSLAGGGGEDTINGGEGNDTITGGAGADLLTGGGGSDVFVFANNASVAAASVTTLGSGGVVIAGTTFLFSDGVDVITDFSATDKIDAAKDVASVTLLSISALSNNTNYSVRGTYNETTFVVAEKGADMLFAQGIGTTSTVLDLDKTKNFVVLQGFGAINGADTIAESYFV